MATSPRGMKLDATKFTTPNQRCIGIRLEDKNRWERRVPLAPSHVAELVKMGYKVLVQKSNIRCFSDEEYEEVGAVVQEDISEAATIFAVKQVPVHLLIPNRTYVYFSHTIKAQPDNMFMLDTILENNIRLIDYEKITDAQNSRLVKFGPFAGYAGTIDTLHALGDRLLAAGYATPFLSLSYSKFYANLAAAQDAVRAVAERIRTYGLPKQICPFTIVITGAGSVSKASKAIIDLLPCKYVDPNELEALWKSNDVDTHCVYVAVATAEHMVAPRKEGAKFDKAHYYANPDEYKPVFHEKILPYTRVILNCMYWERKYPRLVTIKQARKLRAEKRLPLVAVGDISCDPNGSIEFLVTSTEIDDPVYLYDLKTGKITYGTVGEGILMMGVDHLPAEFPVDSSTFFGDTLLPFVKPIADSDMNAPLEVQLQQLPPEVAKAVITCHNKLTPKFEYITELRKHMRKSFNQILLLGAGFVAAPIVTYLMRDISNCITVGSAIYDEAVHLCAPYKERIQPVEIDIHNEDDLSALIESHDIVLSLIPAAFHEKVAKLCIKHRKNMITASYISPGMRALHDEAKKAGIFILNELGLDPGIDHMSVMQILDKIKEDNGKLVSFSSYCGALPAPECSDNPMAYKFSWSPIGVLNAAKNSAKFLDDGVLVEIPGHLLYDTAKSIDLYPAFAFEAVPNRDSVSYIDTYGFNKDDIKTIIRGTLRYPGFALVIRAFSALGLLDNSRQPFLETNPSLSWADALYHLLSLKGVHVDKSAGQAGLIATVKDILVREFTKRREEIASLGYKYTTVDPRKLATPEKEADDAIGKLRELGLFSSNEMVDFSSSVLHNNPFAYSYIDVLCALLKSKLTYQDGERDVVVMHHEFVVEYYDQETGKLRETKKLTASMCVYGDNESSATSKTVGLPVGIACRLAIDGQFDGLTGVCGPVHKFIYEPVMASLEKEGIVMWEQQ